MDLQHTDPAWRQEADYVIGAKINDPVWSQQYEFEQLAAKKISDTTFQICCIPFALHDVNLGDEVTVDSELNVEKVVKQSDFVGLRIATSDQDDQKRIVNRLKEITNEIYIEYFSEKLIALDVANSIAQQTADVLEEFETSEKILQYETIKS